MDKRTAATLEGMLVGARAHLEALADPIRRATPRAQQHARLMKLGRALTELLELSYEIYDEHPELEPRPAAAARRAPAKPRRTPSR